MVPGTLMGPGASVLALKPLAGARARAGAGAGAETGSDANVDGACWEPTSRGSGPLILLQQLPRVRFSPHQAIL